MEEAAAANQQLKLIQQADISSDEVVSKIDDGSIDGVVGLVLSAGNVIGDWFADRCLLRRFS